MGKACVVRLREDKIKGDGVTECEGCRQSRVPVPGLFLACDVTVMALCRRLAKLVVGEVYELVVGEVYELEGGPG